ncbi:hypothetical protein [Roseibacillus ishigakijimensis]|uniref:hypothetical protein n=1 Tax=Roseibacillus ishigakijimensis TaxID=454146 RepID=UPI0019062C10|nr:hypothetical protein [Roseibacillus ishigakijimensis]
MPHTADSPPRKRPSFFWWALVNLLALAFAVLTWTGCYFLFQFPEKPWNYSLLERLGRLPEISFFDGKDLPKGSTLTPEQLYGLIYARKSPGAPGQPGLLDATTLKTLNEQLKRNYITNFSSPLNVNYIRGTWRILSVRELTEADFASEGFAVLAQALAVPADQLDTSNPQLLPFPVELEIILPTAPGVTIPADTQITTDNSFEIDRARYGLAILHVTATGTVDEPVSRITCIPLLDRDFRLSKDTRIKLTAPSQLNPSGIFPLFKDAKRTPPAPERGELPKNR